MSTVMGLTQEEQAVAERYIVRLERRARTWPRTRFFAVAAVLAVAWASVHCMYHFFRTMDEQPYVRKHFERIEIPQDALLAQWLVAELRRSVAMLELINRKQMLNMLEGLIGVVLAVSTIVATVLLITHWNDGPVHGVFAKALRWQLAQACASSMGTEAKREAGHR